MKQKRTYTPKKTANFESQIKNTAMNTIDKPLLGPLEIRIVFNFKRAKSSKDLYVTKRPDLDNLQKSVFDALNKVAWKDDSQIIRVHAEKNFSDVECIEITIVEIKTPWKIPRGTRKK